MADQNDSPQSSRRNNAGDIRDISGDIVLALRIPFGVAMPPQLDSQHSILTTGGAGERLPDVTAVGEAVDQNHSFRVVAPIKQMQSQPVGRVKIRRSREWQIGGVRVSSSV